MTNHVHMLLQVGDASLGKLMLRIAERAMGAYAQFIEANVQSTSGSPLDERNANDRRILGSDEFAAKMLGDAWCPRSRKTLTDLIADACTQFDVPIDTLRSRSCERRLTKARAWIAHQALVLQITSLSEVARTFNRSEASLRESVKRHFNYP
jgi:putative transposase